MTKNELKLKILDAVLIGPANQMQERLDVVIDDLISHVAEINPADFRAEKSKFNDEISSQIGCPACSSVHWKYSTFKTYDHTADVEKIIKKGYCKCGACWEF